MLLFAQFLESQGGQKLFWMTTVCRGSIGSTERARRMSATMLVHVPVDEIEIVWGSLKFNELFDFAGLTDESKSVEMNVILLTSASRRTFKSKLTITSVSKILLGRRSNNRAIFVGTFAGHHIEGIYNTKSRKGSFHLVD